MEKYGVKVPATVERVYKAAMKSAMEIRDPDWDEKFKKSLTHLGHCNGEWTICDNYERFTSLVLRYKDGHWVTYKMYGEIETEISAEEAENEARYMWMNG